MSRDEAQELLAQLLFSRDILVHILDGRTAPTLVVIQQAKDALDKSVKFINERKPAHEQDRYREDFHRD